MEQNIHEPVWLINQAIGKIGHQIEEAEQDGQLRDQLIQSVQKLVHARDFYCDLVGID